jgi:hypothetical protein
MFMHSILFILSINVGFRIRVSLRGRASNYKLRDHVTRLLTFYLSGAFGVVPQITN